MGQVTARTTLGCHTFSVEQSEGTLALLADKQRIAVAYVAAPISVVFLPKETRVIRRGFSSAMLLALLVGCGGGGSSSVPGSPRTVPSITPVLPGNATATVSILIPVRKPSSHGRSARFVSPGAQSIGISVYSVNGVVQASPPQQVVSLAALGPSCATVAATTTCTASIAIPAGVDVFSVASYASANATGTALGTGLSVPQTIYVNSANRVTLALSGIVANLYVFAPVYSFVPGTPAMSPLFVIPIDPSGNPIVNPGPYATAVSITSSLPSVTMSVNGGAALGTVSIASPNDVVTVHYDGTGGVGSVTLTASTAATPPQVPTAPSGYTAIGISPAFVALTLAAPTGTYASGGSYAFDTAPALETATVTIASGGPASSVFSTVPSVASVSPASGNGPFTITRVGIGSATIVVNNGSGGNGMIPVSVSGPFAQQLVAVSGTTIVGNTLNMGAAATGRIALSGGTGLYTLGTTCSAGQLTIAAVTGGYRLTPVTPPTTCAITPTDGVSTGPTVTVNTYATPLPSTGSLGFTNGLGAGFKQSFTLSGGLQPYTIQSVPAFLSAVVNGGAPNQIDVYPTTAGTGSLVIVDALGQLTTAVNVSATTVTIPIL